MTYEESVQKGQWRSVAIHKVVALAYSTREHSMLVEMEYEACIRSILEATSPEEAKTAMSFLAFQTRKYTEPSMLAESIMNHFGEID